jgi:YbbR domain-containing protein
VVNVKNKIFENIGLKFLALIIAAVIWIVVANIDDYKTTRQISGVEIEFINGEAITDNNMVYEVPEGTTVDIIVKGRRKVVEGLSSMDFHAVADLSKMSMTNAVTIVVSANNSYVARDINITCKENTVNVAVEKKIESQMAINVRTSSEVADGYAIRSKTPTPNLITVTGAESVIDMISEVVVDVDVSGASADLTANSEPIFLSKSGEVIDSAKFEYDVKTVDVTIEVAKTKDLALKIKAAGEPKEGYAIAGIDYQPTSITVVGDESDLAKVDEILIDDIDVTDLTKDLETSVQIADYLPNGITVVGSTEEIMVKIMIEELVEKNMIITSDSINIVGRNEEYSYEFLSGNSYSLKLKGLKDKLDNLIVTNLIPSIDVTDCGPGRHSFVVNMREIAGVEYLDTITVDIEIKQNE